jgi:hypothetical protein
VANLTGFSHVLFVKTFKRQRSWPKGTFSTGSVGRNKLATRKRQAAEVKRQIKWKSI